MEDNMLTKDQVLNQMTESPEGGEYYYPLTEHIGINIVSIVLRNEKWYLNLWNDYHDYTVFEVELKEQDALEYLTYDINKNKVTPALDIKVIEDLGLLQACAADMNVDVAEKTVIRIKQYLQKKDRISFANSKLKAMYIKLINEQQSKLDMLLTPKDINLIRLLQRKYYKEGLEEIVFFSKDNRELKEINKEIEKIIGGNENAKI